LVDKEKKVDAISNDDGSKKHEKFEETVKEVLKLHDQLLKMGFKELAENALKIRDNLLGIKEETVESDIGRRIKKLKDLKAYNILIAELKEKRDTLKQSSLFLRDDTGHIYGKLGGRKRRI
jgi:hypothetical protein